MRFCLLVAAASLGAIFEDADQALIIAESFGNACDRVARADVTRIFGENTLS